jgi:hypothetical protein
MAQLSAEWSYLRPRQALYCDRPVSGHGRRAQPRDGAERRALDRRCSWFLLCVGEGKSIRIRLVEAEDQASAGHRIRCTCGTGYEFEEIAVGSGPALDLTPLR